MRIETPKKPMVVPALYPAGFQNSALQLPAEFNIFVTLSVDTDYGSGSRYECFIDYGAVLQVCAKPGPATGSVEMYVKYQGAKYSVPAPVVGITAPQATHAIHSLVISVDATHLKVSTDEDDTKMYDLKPPAGGKKDPASILHFPCTDARECGKRYQLYELLLVEGMLSDDEMKGAKMYFKEKRDKEVSFSYE
jgi:hypothetical protein